VGLGACNCIWDRGAHAETCKAPRPWAIYIIAKEGPGDLGAGKVLIDFV